jgi:hypothetical protein
MMQIVLPRSWREEFALAANVKREKILQREKMAQFAARQRQMTIEQKIEQKRREQEFAALEAAFAPPQRIVEYRAQLDRYDTNTVAALMDNQQATDFMREKINGLLGSAHTLEDGRRVFKTIDGQQVFDEHGQELDRDTIDPVSIDDKKPKWETFRDSTVEKLRLMKEREQLLDYQSKLDLARERLDKGDITEGELKDMDARLSADMPDAVRQKLGLEKPKTDVVPEPASRTQELPSGMDNLMRQTGLGPTGPAL